MKEKISLWVILLSIIIIALTLGFSYLLITHLAQYFKDVSPNAAAAIIAGIVTVIGYFINRNFERRKLFEQQIREKKLPVYEEFISFLFEVIMGVKTDKPITDAEMEKFMVDFNKKSMVWLSDSSLKALAKWRLVSANYDSSDQKKIVESLYVLEELLFEFRKDIGHQNKNLKKGDLLSIFINDFHQYI